MTAQVCLADCLAGLFPLTSSAEWARWTLFPLCQHTFSDIMAAFKTVS
jgi:hypothetical protein